MDLIHPCLESSCSCEILSTVFTVSAQRVNIAAEFNEQPVQFMIRGDLKNMECIIPLIHHMYRSFLRVVHLKSLLIFGSSKKSVHHLHFGLLTKISEDKLPNHVESVILHRLLARKMYNFAEFDAPRFCKFVNS